MVEEGIESNTFGEWARERLGEVLVKDCWLKRRRSTKERVE